MHESAMYYGKRFFEAYCPGAPTADFSVVEIGSQDVNGSLREVCPAGINYTGLDFVEGKGVDLVISDPYKLPLQDASVDILVSSSCFEHSEFFWLVFLEAMRVLKPAGLFYLNVPSNGFFHQWPVDCWRFYPDSGHALVAWGKRNGLSPMLLESFVGRHSAASVSSGGKWNDFVAVFLKDSNCLRKYPIRMVDSLPEYYNGYSSNKEGVLRHSAESPDAVLMMQQAEKIKRLSASVIERDEKIAGLNQAVDRHLEQISEFGRAIAERDGRIASLDRVVSECVDKISDFSRTLGERDRTIISLDRLVYEQTVQVSNLSQVLARRDEDIAKLNQVVSARDDDIASLRQVVSARDDDIAGLNQAISTRDGDIASLHQVVSACDDDITSLNQVVVERDGKIAGLNHVVAHTKGRVADLDQALAGRDSQIEYLRNEFARLAMEKGQEIGALQQELHQVLHSRSWRVTSPLRKMAAPVWRALSSPIFSLAGKSAKFFKVRRELVLKSSIRQIQASALFDAGYYLASYPDVKEALLDPATHYFLHGWKEHRNPSAAFNTERYLSDNPDVAKAGVNPLIHYLKYGQQEGRRLSRAVVLSEDPSVIAIAPGAQASPSNVGEALEHAHESAVCIQENVPNALIDAEVEDIRNSGLFDEAFYLAMSPDLQPPPDDPIRHYCERGWREGRNPSDDFDTRFYLTTYSDIRNASLNPFWHYVIAGSRELRHSLPDLSARYEEDIYFGAVEGDIQLLAFYASPDWPALRGGRPMFKGHTQPVLPGEELGFYDPLDWRALVCQAQLAKRHGIRGFCFDLSIDADGTVVPQPITQFVDHDEIDIGFCAQVKVSVPEQTVHFAKALIRILMDRRQIRIDDRPVLLVTLEGSKQNATGCLAQLRQRLMEEGIDNPFVIVRWTDITDATMTASVMDLCDALLDLPADPLAREIGEFALVAKNAADVVPYAVVASQGVARSQEARVGNCPLYQGVTLGRDNTSRKPQRPFVHTRFHVRDYRRWLDAALAAARGTHPEDRRFIFLNAWNDWNEGLFLEPDRNGGFSRLNETTRALLNVGSGLPMPKVSVIVPNYNHEPFLRRRLDSIYGQTYKNIEVLLLDDCSSDQSRSVLDHYAAQHPEVTRTLYNGENSGSAFRQWSKGIKAVTGDLVWIAESDDFCDERFLEVLVRCFDDEAVLLAYANSIFVNKKEIPIRDSFQAYISDLDCAEKWTGPYVETAHNEVRSALGIKNTIPNASGVLFKRPIDMPLLEDPTWLSMRVAGDWIFYLHIIRGGKIAYRPDATNFFRRYEGSTAEVTYKKEAFYREVGLASRTVAALYEVPLEVLEQCRKGFRSYYAQRVGDDDKEFALWYDYQAILQARQDRSPNIMVSTMGFFPGGAEILPIRMANEFKRQGFSVLLLNAGLNPREDGVRRMLRNDVPVVETSDVNDVKTIIHEFGVEALNTHQWHIQKYPLQVPDVFDELNSHVASLHGMIEHGEAFATTEDQLRKADKKVTTWVYTAEKNLVPFSSFGLYDKSSTRFVKIPNGMQPPEIVPVSRAQMDIPQDAFVLCCVSRAIPDKGWAEAIQAVERARELSGRDIRLILVGNGPVYDQYCRVGVPDCVYLAGFSENSVGHYASADMGIMLTKFKSESFPLTIVDCLFAGKPYIASDVGDIKNMLTAGDDVAGAVIGLDSWEVPIERAARVIADFASDRQKYLAALALVEGLASRYRIDVVASHYVRLFEAGRHDVKIGSRASLQ